MTVLWIYIPVDQKNVTEIACKLYWNNEITYLLWQSYDCIWGSFEKFVDSHYFSELELCGGAVTVSFSKYLPWQAMHFLQYSTYFLKSCCRPSATSFRRIVEQVVSCLRAPFSWLEKPKNCMRQYGLYGGCCNGVPQISVSTSIATVAVCGLALSW
jgi:hypothetical protein